MASLMQGDGPARAGAGTGRDAHHRIHQLGPVAVAVVVRDPALRGGKLYLAGARHSLGLFAEVFGAGTFGQELCWILDRRHNPSFCPASANGLKSYGKSKCLGGLGPFRGQVAA
jgi:hypothetical protein